MGFKEYEDNLYTKEKDKIETYLFRIIQRYFDIENVHSQENIEAIIVESFGRFKEILSWQKDFIFSVNNKAGHVLLTIKDVGGELAFEKNTAFNKDFGIDADTICEGNDPRLSDERIPIEHVHEISNVRGLQEKLDEISIPLMTLHTHKNRNVLDILKYTGVKTQIDLIIIEELQKAIEGYYDNLKLNQTELSKFQQKGIEDLTFLLFRLQGIIQDASVLIADTGNWLQRAYKYTDVNVDAYKLSMIHRILDYATKAQVQTLKEYLKKARCVVSDGEFPLVDGEISFVPTEEDIVIDSESYEGDALKTIYDEGLRLGNDDWTWDSATQSFVYQHNEMDSYPMFVSINKFKNYTHRVTLSSVGTDNDCISVVIAYDEDSGNHLSLVIAHGGVLASGQSGAHANIMYNFTGAGHNMAGGLLVDAVKLSTSSANWNAITNGITVLIKRNENNIKIWLAYNTPHSWYPEIQNEIKDIYPTETPTFDFNLTDYPELSVFADKDCNYGYGCFSQPYSTYGDVYFEGAYIFNEPYGHTDISEDKTVEFSITPGSFAGIAKPESKLFFRYDEDGKTMTVPLPFNFKDSYGNNAVIQGACDDAGNIKITTNFMNTLPLYVDSRNMYNADTIIVPVYSFRDVYENVVENLNKMSCSLCLIDSEAKNNFVKNLLLNRRTYFIQGQHYEYETSGFVDNNMNPMTYFDWDGGQPLYTDLKNVIYINRNKKWAVVNDRYTNRHGYVVEYKIRKLSQYFQNPRIYYQVLGTKEVV